MEGEIIFPCQNNHKNLDLFYGKDLEFWDGNGRENPSYSKIIWLM